MMMPFDWWRGALTFGAIMAEAQMVIAMRMMGMSGWWNVDPAETRRMVAEKVRAAGEAGRAASGVLLRGGGAAALTTATLRPVRRRTRDNLRRLHKRGPFAEQRR